MPPDGTRRTHGPESIRTPAAPQCCDRIAARGNRRWTRAASFPRIVPVKRATFLSVLSALCLAASLPAGCRSAPPAAGGGAPRIILDTDVGSSTDDLFALEMLYRYEDAGRSRARS